QVRNDLHSGRLPPVQPFHAMAYPFSADLALAISSKYAQYCALTASCMRPPPLTHPRVSLMHAGPLALPAATSVLRANEAGPFLPCQTVQQEHLIRSRRNTRMSSGYKLSN